MSPTVTSVRAWSVLFAVALAAVAIGTARAETRVFDLALKNGQLPENQRLVRVTQGDEVTLKWTTDRPYTLHVHGYDLETKLVPQTPVELKLTARATGRFPMEIHGPGTERTIGHLEVHPR
jgi:FtsP/CotA-like multicopper oxidase with cupredoxin domain